VKQKLPPPPLSKTPSEIAAVSAIKATTKSPSAAAAAAAKAAADAPEAMAHAQKELAAKMAPNVENLAPKPTKRHDGRPAIDVLQEEIKVPVKTSAVASGARSIAR
jgi:hypothetical protein